MFPRGSSLVVLLTCGQQLQQLHAESIENPGPPWLPGDEKYYVKLLHVDLSEGVLTPAFHPDIKKYSIRVQDQYAQNIEFTLSFDMSKYDLRHTPELLLDGKKVHYNPLRLMSVVIPLNESIGRYDRTHVLRVQDPKHKKFANWIDTTKHFDYQFHIEQQAEYEHVVKASNISVRVKSGKNAGKVILSTPTFKPFPQGTEFEFNVTHSDRLLEVKVDCTEFATSRLVDGAPSNQPRGSYMELSMNGYVKKQVTYSCIYKDPVNSRETIMTYTLTFLRDVDLRDTSVDLFMMPQYGYCLARSTYDDRLTSIYGQQQERTPDYTKGFVCLSDKPELQIMAKINLTSGEVGTESVDVLLSDPKTRHAMALKHYVPVQMPQIKERRVLNMQVRRGRDRREFPVLFIWPESCAAARCPEHHAPKEHLAEGPNAEDHMCLEEACTRADVSKCCEKLSTCSSMQCPTTPAAQVKGWNCMHATCHPKDDKKHCCDGWFSCNEYTCPTHKIQRPNASRTFCKSTMCTQRDSDLCCESAAKCTEFQNKFGCMKNGTKVNMPPGAANRHCADSVCNPEDAEHCCGDVSSCVSYKCPGGWLLRPKPEALTCTGKVCKPEDAPRCCVKANPSNKPAVDEKGKITNMFSDGTSNVQLADGEMVPKVPNWAIREPSGKKQPAPGDEITIRKAQDGSGFIPYMKAVQEQEGEIVKNLNNGAYKVKFADGDVANVPEWSLDCDDTSKKSVLKPGTKVKAAVSEDGDFIQHGSFGGFIRKIHADGTNRVEFDNGEIDDHVPPWALRGVDDDGHIFVHSTQMSSNERVIANKLKNGKYRRETHATATVLSANDDGTYTVKYLSGEKDSHVPKWDVRAVDQHGHTVAMENVKEGTVVEVNLGEEGRSEASKADLHDRPRTLYLFGLIEKANPDGTTYSIKYDLGISEAHVPGWAIKKIEEDGVGRSHRDYKVGDRVEARLTRLKAAALQNTSVVDIGIATREQMAVYQANDCWPAAAQCRDYVAPPNGTLSTPQEIPGLPVYEAWKNPYKLRMCYYEPACSKLDPMPKGCNVGNNRPSKNCRYCGFDNYDDCKRPYHCMLGEPKEWPQVQRDWCCNAYNIGCKYQCRWGKWWPDEAKGWGPWWSPEKREWCCKNQKIGCEKNKEASNLHRPADTPTRRPTDPPTHRPTDPPTHRPTDPPTRRPTRRPTDPPTHAPAHRPTDSPAVFDYAESNEHLRQRLLPKSLTDYAESNEQLRQRLLPKSFTLHATMTTTASAMLAVMIAASILAFSVRWRTWNWSGERRPDDPRFVPVPDAEPLLS